MNKYLHLLLIIILLSFFSMGFNNPTNQKTSIDTSDLEPTAYNDVDKSNDVTMSVNQGSVTPSSLDIIFTNTSTDTYIFGEYFYLEQKINDEWYQVPIVIEGDYGFNDIAYELKPKNTVEKEVKWEWLYGQLEPGHYRIIKDVLDSGYVDYNTYYLTAEFTI